jgi:biopolymer transport protein ExbB/TolQ
MRLERVAGRGSAFARREHQEGADRMSRTARKASGSARGAYSGTLALLALALAFPVALMVFNPTLMFERGWEQYVGTSIYVTAVVLLTGELRRLWRDHRAFAEAPAMLEDPASIDERDNRLLPARLRALAGHGDKLSVAQMVELNREASALDQDHAAGRFTLTRYILYLLPVIGFIGTVEGISKALMNISKVLPMVKELDGFLDNLTGVTSALQIAFDSTLLALFLSAALMLVQTLVQRRAEDLLARVDRWIVEHVLPRAAVPEEPVSGLAALGPRLERIDRALEGLAERLAPHVDHFAAAVDRLPPSIAGLQRGAEALGRLGDDLDTLSQTGDAVRKAASTLGRIEAALAADSGPDEQLEAIKRGIDRSCVAIESLAGQFSTAFERNSRATQEQLARTLHSLKDALDLLNVSIEQGNALYRNIVKKMFEDRPDPAARAA